MKESFLKVDGPFLPLTSPVPFTSARGLVYLYTKNFFRCSYILGITTYSLMHKWFPLLELRHAPRHCSWGLDGTKYWSLFIVEYLQPNKFKEKPNFNPMYQVSCFSSLGCASCCHVFPEKGCLLPSAQGKKIMFSRKKILSFQIAQERSCAGAAPFGKTLFSGDSKKISYFRYFLRNILFHFPSNM